jgi:hypothetical protein
VPTDCLALYLAECKGRTPSPAPTPRTANAEQRIARARDLPGFRDEPDCFVIDGYELDRDEWLEGYVTV